MPASRSSGTQWVAVLLFVFSLLSHCIAQADPVVHDGHLWVPYTSDAGTVWLMDDRQPALYTQSFGDCQGDSLLNISRFDAAYYKDNMTVLFHLEGISALANESVVRKSCDVASSFSCTDHLQSTLVSLPMASLGSTSLLTHVSPTSTACAQ